MNLTNLCEYVKQNIYEILSKIELLIQKSLRKIKIKHPLNLQFVQKNYINNMMQIKSSYLCILISK